MFVFYFNSLNLLFLIFSPLFSGLAFFLLSKRAGLFYTLIVYSTIYVVCFLQIIVTLINFMQNEKVIFVKLFDFINFNDFLFSLDFLFDSLTLSMLFVVLVISYLVTMFSIWYMKGDPNYLKFIYYLNLFSFFMLVLVAANNIILLFIGWEGIGIFSYLLINFWSTRLNANRSAVKAIFLNKIGDCFFYFFIALYYFIFETFSIYDVKLLITSFTLDVSPFTSYNWLLLLTFSLFLAAMAKSAQIFLHVWLPDAMEGPTPVSALLHAATMVTAGIYVLIKFNWLLIMNNDFFAFIVVVGVLTNLFASLTAVFQYDIKKIIAYSTASQLGLIFIAFGTLNFGLAFFHIFNHAFFKALLFILSGVVIHNLSNNQDIRKMNNLKKNLFFVYAIFLIASLTLIGFPFFSAFYSKELIIQASFINIFLNKDIAIFFLSLSVVTTALYAFKLVNFVFFSQNVKTFQFCKKKALKSLYIYTFVIYILCFLSIFIGYLTSIYFQKNFLTMPTNFSYHLNSEKFNVISFLEFSTFFVLFYTIVGLSLLWFELIFTKYNSIFSHYYFYFFLGNKKFLFDNFYYYLSNIAVINLNLTVFLIDKKMIEPIIVYSVTLFSQRTNDIKTFFANLRWWGYLIFILSFFFNIFLFYMFPYIYLQAGFSLFLSRVIKISNFFKIRKEAWLNIRIKR